MMFDYLRDGKENIIDLDRLKYCAECGGKCCKGCPGCAWPEDFKEPLLDSLVAAFRSEKWAIDWWEGDPRDGVDELSHGYFVRPAVCDAEGIFDPTWGGPCVFLTESGCELPPDVRPKNCRMLEAKTKDCQYHGEHDKPKQDAAIAWIPYQAIILEAEKIVTR